jgi:hypothetical protein
MAPQAPETGEGRTEQPASSYSLLAPKSSPRFLGRWRTTDAAPTPMHRITSIRQLRPHGPKSGPVQWRVRLIGDDREVAVSTAELTTPHLFARAIRAQLGRRLPRMSWWRWTELLADEAWRLGVDCRCRPGGDQ